MPSVTKEWIESLDENGIDAVLALAAYHLRTVVIFDDVDYWFRFCVDNRRSVENRQSAMIRFLDPYWTTWASLLFVVHEGLNKLRTEDNKLKESRSWLIKS